MTDKELVDWLRNCSIYEGRAFLRQAADRIEALTAEVERLNAGLYQAQEIALKAWADKTEWVQQTCQNHELGLHRADVLRYRIEALTAENERLRGAYKNANEAWGIAQLEAERLRPQVVIADEQWDAKCDEMSALTAENARLRSEMVRILLVKQSLLNPIHTIHHMQRIARAALGDTQ